MMSSASGAIKEFLISGAKVHSYSLKEACSTIGSAHSHLVSKKSSLLIDCTGQYLNIDVFCLSKHQSSNRFMFSRMKDNSFECHLGDNLKVSYVCKGSKDDRYCNRKPEDSCRLLRVRFAQSHEISKVLAIKNQSFLCHFSKKKN